MKIIINKLFVLLSFLLIGNFLYSQIESTILNEISDYRFSSDGAYDVISGGEEYYVEQIGAPKLPILIKKYILPLGSELTGVTVTNSQKNTVSGKYDIYPAQTPYPLNWSSPPEFVEPDPIIYNSSTIFPSNIVEVIGDGYVQGYHIVTLKICPFEYIPKDKILSFFNNVEIELTYSNGSPKLTKRISLARHNIAKQFISSMIENSEDINSVGLTANLLYSPNNKDTRKLNLHFWPSEVGDIPDYIVITSNELKTSFEPFVEYKIKKGIPTLLVTTEEIYENISGCDNAEKIRNYLKMAREYWGDALYVLLGGDTEVIPARIGTKEVVPFVGDIYFRVTDMYYCDLFSSTLSNYNWNHDNDYDYGWDEPGCYMDYSPDNFIGRAPVKIRGDVVNFVNKIISYENLSNISDYSYVNNLLLLGAYLIYDNFSYITEDFETIDQQDSWEIISIQGGSEWNLTENGDENDYMTINGEDNMIEEDWLIYDKIYFHEYAEEIFSFDVAYENEGGQLELLYSSDYEGDPTIANWQTISFNLPPEGNMEFYFSGDIDLSGIEENGWLAFKFTSIGSGSPNWAVDNIYIEYIYSIETGQEWMHLLYNEEFANIPELNKWRLFDDYLAPGGAYNEYPGDEELDRNTTLDYLNSGNPNFGKFHFISHFDHGGVTGIGTSGLLKGETLYRADMDNLSNGSSYQIMFTGACEPGEFQKDCFSEHYINAQNGGGVAIVSNSGFGWQDNVNQELSFFQSIYEIEGGHILGLAFEKARDSYYNYSPENNRVKNLNLLGEPTMEMWTAEPQTFSFTVPSTFIIQNSSTNLLPVTVSGLSEKATICLYKKNQNTNEIEVYADTVVPAGSSSNTIMFDLHPDTEGELNVKVTAKNNLPQEKSVSLEMPEGHLYITEISFVDENENGFIEVGESIDLSIQLTNSGNTSISDITSILSADEDFVNITNSTVEYSNIDPGSTIQLATYSFEIITSDNLPPYLNLKLDVSGAGGYSHLDDFYLDITNPELKLGKRVTTDISGNYINEYVVDENVMLYIDLFNNENLAISGLTAKLTSSLSTDLISISESSQPYSDINAFDVETNVNPFVFTFLQTVPDDIPFTLTVTNEFGQEWNFDFMLPNLPINKIQGYNFSSTTNSITITWDPLGTNWFNIYRSSTEMGVYQKVNSYLITGSSMFFDAGVEELSEYYYKISNVRIGGNELPLDLLEPHHAWTSLSFHTNFPISAFSSTVTETKASISVANIDNDEEGTLEIFPACTNNKDGLIMGFDESGDELFDIDNHATTVSGFAKIILPPDASTGSTNGGELASQVAIGDIDNDGHAEVFASTDGDYYAPNRGYLFGFKTVDEIEPDNQPDPFWDEPKELDKRTLSSPVIADLDGEDGLSEIITVQTKQKISVFNIDGNSFWEKNVAGGVWGGSYGYLAVADLDNNGKMEVIIGTNTPGAIYIYNYDGTDFNDPNPIYTSSTIDFGANPIIADINNDGQKDIIIVGRDNANDLGYLYAFNYDGSFVDANWGGQITLELTSGSWSTPQPAVGDLNYDGNLEIVVTDKDKVYSFNNNGIINIGFPISIEELNTERRSPILADIDADSDIEIIFVASDNKIYAFDNDGNECVGWRLSSNMDEGFAGTPTVADIDNDGFNEIMINDIGNTTYVWNTTGDADKIEWGSFRANAQNTGEYRVDCKYSTDYNVEITENATWTSNKRIMGDLIINDGTILTISSTVYFVADSKVIIKAGGKLILDGGTLTNACSNLWQGVEVWGNDNSHNPIDQGRLVLKNLAVIKNAEVGARNFFANEGMKYGGIITADNSKFINNHIAVQLNRNPSYSLYHFNNCDFESNNDGLGYTFDTFISTERFIGLRINGTSFINNKSTNTGYGIKAKYSHFIIDENSNFENLLYAINTIGDGHTSGSIIKNSSFINNDRGIYVGSIDEMEITNNEFEVPVSSEQPGLKTHGTYLERCNGYVVEENHFESYNNSGKATVGLYVRNSGTNDNQVYNNTFTELAYGAIAYGQNRGEETGLCFKCNTFTSNDYDIAVFGKKLGDGIKENQGSNAIEATAPAANRFSNDAGSLGIDNQGTSLNYWYPKNKINTLFYPADKNGEVYLFENQYQPWTYEDNCPESSGGGSSTESTERSIMASNEAKSDSTQNILNLLVDGGDTQGTTQEVETAYPPETYEVYNKLMNKSPYLSDKVVKASIEKEEVLPNVMIRDIMVANPQSAKEQDLMDKVDERTTPMPDYMKAQILAGKDLVGYMEKLESEKGHYAQKRATAYHNLIRLYQQDSLLSTDAKLDSVIALVSNENTLFAQYRLVMLHFAKEDYSMGQNILSAIPNTFTLNAEQSTEHNYFTDYYQIATDLAISNDTITTQQISDLEYIMEEEAGLSAAYARNLLIAHNAMDYVEEVIIPEGLHFAAHPQEEALQEALEAHSYLSLFPNPAKDYLIVKYELEMEYPDAQLQIYDSKGSLIKTIAAENIQDQKVISTTDLKAGTYFIHLYFNHKEMESQKFTIVK